MNEKADEIFKMVPNEMKMIKEYLESLRANRDERNERISKQILDRLPDDIAKSRVTDKNKRWIYILILGSITNKSYIEDSNYLRDVATKDDMLKITGYINDAGFKTKLSSDNHGIYVRDPDVKFLGIF